MANEVLKTSADDLYELVKSKKKISVEEAAKLLRMPMKTVHALVDFLVEEKIFGIEYKFTTPYVYMSEEHPKKEAALQDSFTISMITKEEFFEKAQRRNVPFDRIYELWNRYIKENLESIKKEFYMKAESRGMSKEMIDTLWKKYKEDFATHPGPKPGTQAESMEPASFSDTESKGDLAMLEKNYLEMWDKASKEGFNWNGSLYTDLTNTGTEIKKELGSMMPKISGEKSMIKRLIDRTIHALESRNYGEALKLYSELIDRRNNIQDAFFEDKKELNREVLPLYAKLAEQIDAKLIRDFNDSAAKADSLVKDSFSSVEKGEVEKARNCYVGALGIYMGLPHGFLKQKIELGSELAALYKELSIRMQITDLKKQLSYNGPNDAARHANHDHFKRLSEIAGHGKEKHTELMKHFEALDSRPMHEHQNKSLLDRIVSRRLEKASASIGKGLYNDARKNIESVLRLDPQNKNAKKMLGKIPA